MTCVIGAYCSFHGFVHGAEASELRTALEPLVECDDRVAKVLEKVDARDSLAFEIDSKPFQSEWRVRWKQGNTIRTGVVVGFIQQGELHDVRFVIREDARHGMLLKIMRIDEVDPLDGSSLPSVDLWSVPAV